MKRIYVAGAISSSNPVTLLGNLRKGIHASVQVLQQGFAVFSPFIDFQFFLHPLGESITAAQIKAQSLAWLEASDAVLVLPGSEKSSGTQAEIKRAKEVGIPVYHSMDVLRHHEQPMSDKCRLREVCPHNNCDGKKCDDFEELQPGQLPVEG